MWFELCKRRRGALDKQREREIQLKPHKHTHTQAYKIYIKTLLNRGTKCVYNIFYEYALIEMYVVQCNFQENAKNIYTYHPTLINNNHNDQRESVNTSLELETIIVRSSIITLNP